MTNTSLASNVLNNISSRLKGDSSSSDKVLILFTGSNNVGVGFHAHPHLDNKLQSLKCLKEKGFDISIGFSFMAERILDLNKIKNILNPRNIYKEEDIFKIKSIIKDNSILYCPNITVSTLSKVSLGMIDTFASNIIWTFLYQGKEVYLDFNSARYYLGMESKSKDITKLIDNYINTVTNMGAKEISWEDLSYKNRDKDNSPTNLKATNGAKELITERDILNLNKKVLVLNNNTLITPLAKDKARELGIEIQIK